MPKHADLACLRHHLQLPDEALREHATCCLVSPEHSSPALPRLLLLSALELWPASQQLLASASHGLLCADLWLQLPWRAWLKMLKAFLAAPWLGRGYSSRMHPSIAGLLHAPKKRAAAAQTAMRGCHAAVSAVQSLRSRSLNTQVAAGRASAATRSSSEHDPPARLRARLRHRGTRSDGVVCRNRMRRRLQPAHRRLQPHAPQAATPRIRGCNRMHLRLQPHAPQVCRGAARLLRRGVLAARRRVLAAAQRLEPRPAAWPAHSGRPAARRRSLQRALAAGLAGWGRLRVPVGAACAPRATELLPAAASERRGRQPRHAPPWLSGAVASALAIRRASGGSWSCRAPEAIALLAGAPARWKWPPRCATA